MMAALAGLMVPDELRSLLRPLLELAADVDAVAPPPAPTWARPLFLEAAAAHRLPVELLEALSFELAKYRPDFVGADGRIGILGVRTGLTGLRATSAELLDPPARPAALERIRLNLDRGADELAQLRGSRGSLAAALEAYADMHAGRVAGTYVLMLMRRLPAASLDQVREMIG